MEEALFRVGWVQTKSYSGFFKISTNSLPYGLLLTDSFLRLKVLGIPFVKISIENLTKIRRAKEGEWVITQKTWNGIIITYKKGNGVKERIITFFDKEKSDEFFKILQGLIE